VLLAKFPSGVTITRIRTMNSLAMDGMVPENGAVPVLPGLLPMTLPMALGANGTMPDLQPSGISAGEWH
jgi:hypothetical protein